jgi:hypothetical protein
MQKEIRILLRIVLLNVLGFSFGIAVKPASGGLCLSEALGITSRLPSHVINLLNTDVIIMIGLCLITNSH